MVRTQIYLTEEEKKAIGSIAQRLGKTQSEVIRSAVDRFIEHQSPVNRSEKLRAGAGLWKDRDDLPEFELLRTELDRSDEAPAGS